VPQRIDFLDLSVAERQATANIVGQVANHLPWERVEAVFRSLGRAEWLIVPHGEELQRALPMTSPTLLRNERAMATAIVMALELYLGEKGCETVLQFLAQRGAALDALLVHGAAVMGISERQQKGRAVL
jgi:hypothetical protein